MGLVLGKETLFRGLVGEVEYEPSGSDGDHTSKDALQHKDPLPAADASDAFHLHFRIKSADVFQVRWWKLHTDTVG